MEPRLQHVKISICAVLIGSILLLSDARLFGEQRMLEPTEFEPYALPPLESQPTLIPTPPFTVVSPPPSSNFPIKSPPNNFAIPPMYTPIARPPEYELNPPSIPPRPHYHGLSPPIYQPPLVHPPITAFPSPPPHKKPKFAVWCVAKPTLPEPIIQAALDYACGSGADCKSIQPNGLCFQPNNLVAHASYAFNSYWQKKKIAGGTCDFGGTAMLVTVDPSK
ncbi:hypothetical protein MANES_08G067900v8 [Manihot esculenta]|uniref:Uncharacterized protein n=1 Tax=Manihot esculenta TaxID=3983 RepID=A0ACB7HDX6_MANES|nr:hypothetical protein MANES_08G067900v8 [Manihot esculenta]